MRDVNLDLIKNSLRWKRFSLYFFYEFYIKALDFICKNVVRFQLFKCLNVATLTQYDKSTFTIYSDWHISLSFPAHQTPLARDFSDNGNKALSFSIDNVIAIGNEAIKMAIKVLILLPSSRIWPFVMPIFPYASRQQLWDSSIYLFKIKGLSNNKKHWQAALAHVGPICGTEGKVREW